MRSTARLTYTQVQQVMDGLMDESDLALPAGTLASSDSGVFYSEKSP